MNRLPIVDVYGANEIQQEALLAGGKWSFDFKADNRLPGRLSTIAIPALVNQTCTAAP